MGRSSIGLDVGTRAVRAVELRGSGSSRAVSRFGRVVLPQGAVEHGEVMDPRAVGEAIQTLWKRLRLTARSVHIGMSNRRVVVRVVDLPAMSRDDLDGAIRLQAQDHIPIPLGQAVMDYEVLEDVTGPEGQLSHRVLVVAAERGSVQPLIEAVQLARLEPRTLELNAYPLVRCLGSGNGNGQAEAIVDVGAGVTNVVIHHSGRIRFTRILPNFGGDDFTAAIAEGMQVDIERAEEIKRESSQDLADRVQGTLDEVPVAVAPSFVEASQVPEHLALGATVVTGQRTAVDHMEPVLNRFVSEVRGSIDFYTAQQDSEPVSRVVLTGGGSLLGGLRDALEGSLGFHTEVGHPFEGVGLGRMKIGPDQMHTAERYLSVAVGLAMAGSGA